MLGKNPPSAGCFMSKVKETLEELPYNARYTENGALGYETSGKSLLDLDFATASLRKKPEKEIQDMFVKAYFENPLMAVKWLFYLRDIRGGSGERRSFRILLKCLESIKPELVEDDFGLSNKEVVDEIQEWNMTLVYYQEMRKNIWIRIFYPDVYGEMDTIEYENLKISKE